MDDLPSYSSLAGVTPSTVYGLLVASAGPAVNGTFEHAWEKDRALLSAIDQAIRAAARGDSAPPAARPRWLDGLIARQLRASATSSWAHGFDRVRLLQRIGLIDVDVDDDYVLAMVGSLGSSKVERLRDDPGLVEAALWRVFDVEGGGEVSLTNVDRFFGGEWRAAFVELTSDGTLDRARVLRSCLEALGRDFAAYRAGWYSATFLALEPTVAEVAELQTQVRRLLGAQVPATVGFAVKQLTALQRAGLLDREATLEALPAAVLAKAKSTAMTALSLARGASSEQPSAVAAVAAAALGNPNADVQRAAAALLSELGSGDLVESRSEDLAPSVLADLGLSRPEGGGEEALGVVRGQSLRAVPTPATSIDLAERVAALLEDASDVGELEAVMAALVDPGSESPLEPLRRRALAVMARGARTDIGDTWMPGQIARLILGLLGEPVAPAIPDDPVRQFLVRRMSEMRTASGPLLATPDLPGGWVSTDALRERLRRSPALRHYDVVAALLRLHPDQRGSATGDEVPPAVRFALDGVEPSQQARRAGPEAWWTAAGRSLSGYAAAEAPRLTSDIRTHTWEEGGRTRRHVYAVFEVGAASLGRPSDDQPTELVVDSGENPLGRLGRRELGDWIPHVASVWPGDAEHFLALTCLPVLDAPTWAEAAHDVPRTLDALARHPGRMGSLAAATLAAGLSASKREHRFHAVDAVVDVVPARVPARAIADVMAAHASAWPATRWVESLASIGTAPGSALVAVEILTALVPQLSYDHRGLNALLDLLRDELIRQGRRATDPTLIAWLGGFPGTSAAARSARLLLG